MSELPPGPDTPATASVFDFLYFDARRGASLLAQLTGSGALQALKRQTTTAKTARLDLQMQGKVGVKIIEGSSGQTDSTTDEVREALEKNYDPQWSNAVDLLNLLDAARLIHRGPLIEAGIGQAILATGSLLMLDLAMLREVWRKPAIRKVIMASSADAPQPQNRADRRAGRRPDMPREAELALDLIDIMPHTLQGWIIQPGAELFFTLQPDALVTPSGDLALKHGVHLGRDWHVLGILDAVPARLSDAEMQDIVLAGIGSQLSQIAAQIALPIRELMGRPPAAHAITPLAIFRELKRAA